MINTNYTKQNCTKSLNSAIWNYLTLVLTVDVNLGCQIYLFLKNWELWIFTLGMAVIGQHIWLIVQEVLEDTKFSTPKS